MVATAHTKRLTLFGELAGDVRERLHGPVRIDVNRQRLEAGLP